MPFTMTHLIISKNVYQIYQKRIKSLSQFYLGSIAPDAVHNRKNYVSDYKRDSHLINKTEIWGMVTNNDEWKNNLLTFLNEYKESENCDFVLGYCSHVLSDMYNNINVWTPFRLKYPDEFGKGYGNQYHQECNKLDIELALTYEGRDDFWLHLLESKSIDLPNIVYATEIDKQKDNILNLWYKDKERQDVASNKIKTLEGEMDFIKNATDFVSLVFQQHIN